MGLTTSDIAKPEVEIGDSLQEDFYPQAKLKRWDNECNFSIRLATDVVGASVVVDGQKTIWTNNDDTVELYEENNEFKIDVVFTKPLRTNIIPFTFRSKGIVFCYQGELTKEEVEDGCNRPERVVGSYALYHESKQHNNYGTGKFGHLYRPKIVDNNKNEAWCSFSDFDLKTESFNIVIPTEFLETAVYPLRLDPDVGYTTLGGTYSAMGAFCGGCSYATDQYTATTGDTATAISIGCFSGDSGDSANVSLYTVGGSNRPDSRVLAGQTISGFPVGIGNEDFGTAVISQSLTNGVSYTVAFGDESGNINYVWDAQSAALSLHTAAASLPATWSHAVSLDRRVSMYFTYTSGGSPPVTTVKDIIGTGIIPFAR